MLNYMYLQTVLPAGMQPYCVVNCDQHIKILMGLKFGQTTMYMVHVSTIKKQYLLVESGKFQFGYGEVNLRRPSASAA